LNAVLAYLYLGAAPLLFLAMIVVPTMVHRRARAHIEGRSTRIE
jgi:hypothetical protein